MRIKDERLILHSDTMQKVNKVSRWERVEIYPVLESRVVATMWAITQTSKDRYLGLRAEQRE